MGEKMTKRHSIYADISVQDATVLLVDDEPVNLKLLSEILHVNGYHNIRSTTDPREVGILCDVHDVDLIILDINMPYLNGFEVMEQLREDEKKAEIPIIILTALIDSEICNRALRDGARDFLTKPFNHIEALSRIRNALETHLLYKQVRSNNERLEEKVRERTDEIYKTRIKVIRRLCRAAEFRDNETGMHIMRMSHYSTLLAQSIGMNKKKCEVILNASPLHDIGKIGIPDRILLKPGKLSSDEWEIMKTHTHIGEKVLEGDSCEFLDMARTIALTHHEKWDGSGYPNGLAGENIPLMGRIVAVADVFDALTSERPYKKAWHVDDAFALLEKEKGKHFEPALVDCFLGVIPELLEIKCTAPRLSSTILGLLLSFIDLLLYFLLQASPILFQYSRLGFSFGVG